MSDHPELWSASQSHLLVLKFGQKSSRLYADPISIAPAGIEISLSARARGVSANISIVPAGIEICGSGYWLGCRRLTISIAPAGIEIYLPRVIVEQCMTISIAPAGIEIDDPAAGGLVVTRISIAPAGIEMWEQALPDALARRSQSHLLVLKCDCDRGRGARHVSSQSHLLVLK